jgi:SAM-dependent methyltransferase
MSIAIKDPRELQSIYERRFDPHRAAYRRRLWQVLVRGYFSRYIGKDDCVVDLACGYGEFINTVACREKIGMDLNPRSGEMLDKDVVFHFHDCMKPWPISPESVDVVFASNFFEHLPDKGALKAVLFEAHRCLKPGGRLMVLGPNIKFVQGAYWDFWAHFLCLTELSLGEALENNGYKVVRCIDRFLPYTTINGPEYPMALVSAYLHLPMVWRIFGKQFFVMAQKQ